MTHPSDPVPVSLQEQPDEEHRCKAGQLIAVHRASGAWILKHHSPYCPCRLVRP